MDLPAIFTPNTDEEHEAVPSSAWKRCVVDEFKPHKEFSVPSDEMVSYF